MMTEPVRHKDFTKKEKQQPVSFNLDGDTFHCTSKLPMFVVRKVGKLRGIEGDGLNDDKIEKFLSILRDIMLDESVELFNRRLESKSEPIDIDEISEIIAWLLEVYGLRPFQESSDSVSGSLTNATENAGTSLMDGAPVLELILSNSPSTDS